MNRIKDISQDTIIENAKRFIFDLMSNNCDGHDYYHTLRVYNTAKYIAEKENADTFTVCLAALLHDADDRKLFAYSSKDLGNAVGFMRSQNISEQKIIEICRIIKEVSFKGSNSVTPTAVEGRAVQDADRLDAIGAVGIARCFAYGGSKGRYIWQPDCKPQANMTAEKYYSSQGSSINHFYEKLLLLKDMMNTETAKQIAEQRHSFLESYLEEFFAEWNGER